MALRGGCGGERGSPAVSFTVSGSDKEADDCTFPGYGGRLPNMVDDWIRFSFKSPLLDEITLLLRAGAGSRLSAFQGGKFCLVTSTLGCLGTRER